MSSSSDTQSIVKAVLSAFRQHPVVVGLLLALGGVGWMANGHDEVRAALLSMLASSFSTVPSGWVLIGFVALGLRVLQLGTEVKNCHDERIRDRRLWDTDRGRLEGQVETANNMVTSLFNEATRAREEAEDKVRDDRRQKKVPVETERRRVRKRKV